MTSAPEKSLTGDELLAAVTDAMIAFHHSYHRGQAVTGRARLLSDQLLACVLGPVPSDVEKTIIELQDATVSQQTRSSFQDDMQDQFIATVERLSGRHVQAFISNHHADPGTEIELFMLTTPPRLPLPGATRGYAYAWERPQPQ